MLHASANTANLHKGQTFAVDHPHKACRAAEQYAEAVEWMGFHYGQNRLFIGAQRVRRTQSGQIQIAYKEVCTVGAAQFPAALP